MKKLKLITICATFLLALTGCNKNENKIVVGASSVPHAEILEQVKPILQEKGYELDIKVYSDYINPNLALEDDEIDANYFQHITYLNNFNKEYNTHLTSVGAIHYEPLGIYCGSKTDLSSISNGDKILVPNDSTNEARALLLLQQANLITLKDNVGINATKYDIVNNPYNLEIVEMNAELIASVRDDAAFAVINGNYAINAKLNVSDTLEIESSTGSAANAYANVLAVKEGTENNDKIKALYEALTSTTIKDYINKNYSGAVVALF